MDLETPIRKSTIASDIELVSMQDQEDAAFTE